MSEESERLRALLDEMIRRTDEALAKAPQEPKWTDRLHRADVMLDSAEFSGATDKFLRAIAYALLAIAFELRELRKLR